MVRAVTTKGLTSNVMKEVAQLEQSLDRQNKANIRRDLLNVSLGVFMLAMFLITGAGGSFVWYIVILISCLMIGVGIGGIQKYREVLSQPKRQPPELPVISNPTELPANNLLEIQSPPSITEETTKHLEIISKPKT